MMRRCGELFLFYTIFNVTVILHCQGDLACETDWSLNYQAETCVRIFDGAKTWENARTSCKEHNGDLIVLDNDVKVKFLKDLHSQHKVMAWIGLRKDGDGNWINGIKVTKYHWTQQAPRSENSGDCVTITGMDTKWNNVSCSEKLGYVCEKVPNNTVSWECRYGFREWNKRCFRWYSAKESWDEANASCRYWNSHLVTIPDKSTQDFISFAVRNNIYDEYWIGLNAGTNKELSWMNSTEIYSYNNFAGSSRTLTGQCVYAGIFAWQWSTCSSRKYAVCEMTATPELHCSPGWDTDSEGKTCFKRFMMKKTWNDAKVVCKRSGGDLITIQDFPFNRLVRDHLGGSIEPFWIGLHKEENVEEFIWSDSQTETLFKNFDTTVATNGEQTCAQIIKNNIYWQFSDCRDKNYFICQRTLDASHSCPEGYTVNKTMATCIKLVDDDFKPWEKARELCQMDGGDLLTIHDQDINTFARGLITNQSSTFWIGLHDRQTENSFHWLDDSSKLDYEYWAEGEPNDKKGKQNCVLIENGNENHWRDDSCVQERNYICQVPLAVGTDTPDTKTSPISMNCGKGWEESLGTDFCYRFNGEPLTWHDARDSCAINGGDLVSVVSWEEMLYLEARLRSFEKVTFWSGGNNMDDARGWSWSNNAPFSFVNWDDGEPNRDASANCLAIQRTTGRWRAGLCEDHRPSICKKLGITINYPTPPPTVPPTKIPGGRVWDCPENWIPFEGSCYNMIQLPNVVDWQGAHQACQNQGADLAAITDEKENNIITAEMQLLNQEYEFAWIGLNDVKRKNSFVWSDGVTPVTFTTWIVGQPLVMGTDKNMCGQIMKTSGQWKLGSCDMSTNVVVCKQNKKILDKADMVLYEGCEKGGIGYLDKCYVFHQSPKVFDDSQETCESKNGNLATVNDRYVQAFLTSQLKSINLWIGLSNTKKKTEKGNSPEFMYSWMSGADIEFTNWDRSHSGKESNTCVGLLGDSSSAGLWHNYLCNATHGFICEYHRPGFTTPKTPPTTINPISTCPDDWFAVGEMCYNYLQTPKTWMEAKFSCEALIPGGTLACPATEDVFKKLRGKLFDMERSFKAWIGLSDRDFEGGFRWTDGQPYIYNHWARYEPDNEDDKQDCTLWTLPFHGDYWQDENCYFLQHYICQAPKGSQLYTTLAPVSLGPKDNRCGKGLWIVYRDHCYGSHLIVSEYKTWHDARDDCLSQGADLISIIDDEENGLVVSMMYKSRKTVVWLGMSDFDGDLHKWADGTPVRYLSWIENEPNNKYGGRCVRMERDGGWEIVKCFEKLGYVCKKEIGSEGPITAAPATVPQGGCPLNFKGMPGTSSCYFVVKKRMYGKNAISTCQEILPNARPASIHSKLDQDFVTTLIADIHTAGVWTGLKLFWSHKGLFWDDQTPVNFVSWVPDQNFGSLKSGCVRISTEPKSAGDWEMMNCFNSHPIVCGHKKDITYPINEPDTTGCLDGYKKFRDSCFKYNTTVQTWEQAEATCANDGGNLVTIDDGFDASFLQILIHGMEDIPQIWIGFSRQNDSDSFAWTDGWPVQYTAWEHSPPDLEKHCVALNNDSKWITQDCQIPLPFFCEINTNIPPYPKANTGYCAKESWTHYGELCFFVVNQFERNWSEAELYCNMEGGNLASLHSPHRNKIISYITGDSRKDVWIGLRKDSAGDYKWSDGSEEEYYNWAPGLYTTMVDRCVLIQGSSRKWTSTNCLHIHGFVCEVKQIPFTTIPSTTTMMTTKTSQAVPMKSSSTPVQTPVKTTIVNTPVKTATTNTPVKTATTNTLVKTATTNTPMKTATTNTPVKTATTNTPVKMTTINTPVKTTTTTLSVTTTNVITTAKKEKVKESQSFNDNDLTSGEITGLVLGLVGIFIIAVVVIILWRKRLHQAQTFSVGDSIVFENVMFDTAQEGVNFKSCSKA